MTKGQPKWQSVELPDEHGYVTLRDSLPGWESFTISVRADLVNGEPRVTGLRVEPRDGAKKRDVVLTLARLRTLPLARLAPVAYHLRTLRPSGLPELVEHMGAVSEHVRREAQAQAAKAGRAKATPEAVAKIYRHARESGERPPRAAICEDLHVSPRTADRYIGEARQRGLLAPYDNKGGDEK